MKEVLFFFCFFFDIVQAHHWEKNLILCTSNWDKINLDHNTTSLFAKYYQLVLAKSEVCVYDQVKGFPNFSDLSLVVRFCPLPLNSPIPKGEGKVWQQTLFFFCAL